MIEQLIIKEVIKKHNTSIKEVAEKMGISRVTLSTHINGNPSVEVLVRIASAIGCDVSDFFANNKKNTTSYITCPNCGEKISVEVSINNK